MKDTDNVSKTCLKTLSCFFIIYCILSTFQTQRIATYFHQEIAPAHGSRVMYNEPDDGCVTVETCSSRSDSSEVMQ